MLFSYAVLYETPPSSKSNLKKIDILWWGTQFHGNRKCMVPQRSEKSRLKDCKCSEREKTLNAQDKKKSKVSA